MEWNEKMKLKPTISIFILVVTSLAFMATSHAQGSAQIGLSPPMANLAGPPGSTATQELQVRNGGTGAFLLACYFNDLWHKDNKQIFAEIGTYKEKQAASQLQCSPSRILIPAGGKQKIKVVGAIPKDLKGDSFAILFTEMRPPEEMKGEGNVQVEFGGRIGAQVILTATGTEKPKAEISGQQITRTERFQTFGARVKNTGNVHLQGRGTLLVMGPDGKSMGKVHLDFPFIFPGQTRSLNATIVEKIPPGNYQGLLSVQSNTMRIPLVVEFPLQVKS